MKVAILGPGAVGSALGAVAVRAGHSVVLGARDATSAKLRAAQEAIVGASVASLVAAHAEADLSLLTVPWSAAEETVRALDGGIVVDCTNPVGTGLRHAIGSRSGAEVIADASPGVRVVKAFNVYGVENLGDPDFGTSRGMLPVAGDDADAKRSVLDFVESMGWEALDVGPLSMALHLEHLALLWIHMVRAQNRDSRFVWSRLTKR